MTKLYIAAINYTQQRQKTSVKDDIGSEHNMNNFE